MCYISIIQVKIMIKRLQFSIDINAEKHIIWKALWDENSYRDWAGVFFEGSYAISNYWEEGSTVLFLSPDKNGIYSMIKTHKKNKIMKFEHIGNVANGIKQPIDDDAKKMVWSN